MARQPSELCTSAEVLQEMLHAYIPVCRFETLDAALTLADPCIPTPGADSHRPACGRIHHPASAF
jgi:hypothetical protein